MISYFNNGYRAYVMIGNFWNEKPMSIHKDIAEAKHHLVKVKDIITKSGMENLAEDAIIFKFRERAKGEHSDALING